MRTQRKRWALPQNDLARLLNRSPTRLCRYERGDDQPDLETILALQVVFGVPPRGIVPGLYSRVEEAVMRRAADLDRRLVGKVGYAADRQRRLLKAMTYRAERPAPDA